MCKGKSWLILGSRSLPLNKRVTKEHEKLSKSYLKEKWVHDLSKTIFSGGALDYCRKANALDLKSLNNQDSILDVSVII